jgi:uncharacterized protein YkwD
MVFRTALLFLAISLIGSATCAAESRLSPKPRLNASILSNGQVEIKVRLTSGLRRLKKARVVLSRAEDNEHLSPYVEISQPATSQTIIDAVSREDIVISYRAVVKGRIGRRAYRAASRVVAIYVPEEESSLPSLPPPSNTPSAEPPPPIALGSGETRCPNHFAQEVLELVNAARADASLGALSLHPQLEWAAIKHSDWMIRENLFSHEGWYNEIIESGFTVASAGQNIAHYFDSPASVVSAWMESPGHRANILKASYTFLGVGCIIGPDGSLWWTQNFGSNP